MQRVFYLLFLILFPLVLQAQNSNGNYNPYVSGGIISPSPLLPLEVNGTGTVSFNIGNTGSDPLTVYPDQYISLTLSLSFGVPDNANPLAAIGGSSAGLFSWSYNAGTYTALQTSVIPANSSGTITIAYKVAQNSQNPGSNGFNVNVTPAPYQTTSNTQNDDAVSSYTYTELKDFGDAPLSYGSADHIIDFTNYLGAQVDGESANQPSTLANADDVNGVDDEDGVSFPAQIRRGETLSIPVTVVGLGYINAWIDWNGDGDFVDAGERVTTNFGRSEGVHNLSVAVPADAIITTPTFARFRFSQASISSPIGSVPGGEVEDYRITILCAPPLATLSINDPDRIFCAGTSVTFTAGGGTNYNFRVGGVSAQNSSSTSFVTSSLTNGQVVDVIVTDAIGCAATSTGIASTVNPLPVPTLSISDPDSAFCAGTSVTFTAGGGSSYNFRVAGLSVQNGASQSYTSSLLTNGQVVDVIVTNASGCIATSGGITNTVYALPLATLASSDPDNIFCAGTSITFTASGGTSYNFRVAGVSAQTGASNTFTRSTLTNNQVVDVVVTNANGCIATSAGITNTVNALPTANAGVALGAICQGSTSVALGGSIGGSATGGTWSSPAGGTFSPNATTLNATWTPPAAYSGTATLTLTTTGGSCGTTSASKTQLVNPSPVVTINTPAAVCSPATVNLTLPAVTTGSTAGLTYTYWTNLAGTTPYATPSAATNGTYYIRGTVAATGCSDIKAVTVTVNPSPSTPVVSVIDNCNGTSSLSTLATGSLLWSNGSTSPNITVSTAGIFTVTTTLNGCTSAPGSATAAPKTAPTPPVVITSAPVNTCPATTINLTSLVTSTTPAGGSVLYRTSNNPLGSSVANPTAVGAGSYYIFYQNLEGCYSTGREVVVVINSCPADLTPTLTVNPNIMHGITSFNLTVRVTELNLMNTNGAITVHIPKDPRWYLPDDYIPSLTIIGTTPLNNNVWSHSSDAINHIFTTSAVIPAGGSSTFGFRVIFNPGSSKGFYSITSQLVSGAGGEVRVTNNADSEKIDYFQQ